MCKRLFIFFVLFVFMVFCIFGGVKKTPRPRKPVTAEEQWKQLEHELRGRLSERVAANKILEKNGWVPIPKKTDLAKMYAAGRLVNLPVNRYLTVNEKEIPSHRRMTTPGFAKYIIGFSQTLRIPLVYNSGARSMEDQREIAGHNGNAAPTTGKKVSAHLYPPAIDFGYDGMPVADRIKFALFLKSEKAKGNVQLAIERHQHCFHIVYLREKASGPPVFSAKPPAKKKTAPKKGGKK
jgi:hypothetical protein